jgi:hypothetical protein
MMPRPRLQEEFAYHPPELKKVVSPAEKILQTVMVAVVGTGLGIGVGVFLAGRTVQPDAAAAASPTPSGGSLSSPAAPKIQTPATAELKPKTLPASAPDTGSSAAKLAVAAKASPDARQSAANRLEATQPRLVTAVLTGVRIGSHRRHGFRHKAGLVQHRKEKTQAVVEEAKLEIPDGRFRFTIEGDQTATDYDAQSGIVSTEGSGTFVVEKAPGEPTAARVQEPPSNIHYKCDQDSNCSLIMANLVVPHARMRTLSHTADWAYVPVSSDEPVRDGSQAPVDFAHVSR